MYLNGLVEDWKGTVKTHNPVPYKGWNVGRSKGNEDTGNQTSLYIPSYIIS